MPYERLWQAVLLRAFMDACNLKYQKEALSWLNGRDKHFNFICHAAGFNPDYVRQRARDANVHEFTRQLYEAYATTKTNAPRGVAKLKGIIMKGTTKKGGKGGKGPKGC